MEDEINSVFPPSQKHLFVIKREDIQMSRNKNEQYGKLVYHPEPRMGGAWRWGSLRVEGGKGVQGHKSISKPAELTQDQQDKRTSLKWARRNKRETKLTPLNYIPVYELLAIPQEKCIELLSNGNYSNMAESQNNRHLNLPLDNPSYWHKPKSLHYNLNSTNEYCKDDRRDHREWSQRH